MKSPISRYAERKRDGRPDASKAVTSTVITLLPPPAPEPARPTTTIPQYAGPGQTSNRMTRLLAILQAEPEPLRRSREIAERLGDVTLTAAHRQLARWTEKGMIKRVRTGRYATVTQETAPPGVTCENANHPALGKAPEGLPDAEVPPSRAPPGRRPPGRPGRRGNGERLGRPGPARRGRTAAVARSRAAPPGDQRLEDEHAGGQFLRRRCPPQHPDHVPAHCGWFPCLRLGSGACLARSMASASISRARLSAGSMTLSTRPRSAA